MERCKRCGHNRLVKNGFQGDNQRYKCRGCGRSMIAGDRRVRYDNHKKIRVLRMYLEGVGIRSIERLEGVSSPLIIRWIRSASSIIQQQLTEAAAAAEEPENIQILELDELFSYCQKKREKSTFGLLLIGSEIALLTLK